MRTERLRDCNPSSSPPSTVHRRPIPNEKQKAALKGMQSAVATCAEELNIAAEIIAPKKELSSSLNGDQESRVFTGWRRELIGKSLLEMLEK